MIRTERVRYWTPLSRRTEIGIAGEGVWLMPPVPKFEEKIYMVFKMIMFHDGLDLIRYLSSGGVKASSTSRKTAK